MKPPLPLGRAVGGFSFFGAPYRGMSELAAPDLQYCSPKIAPLLQATLLGIAHPTGNG